MSLKNWISFLGWDNRIDRRNARTYHQELDQKYRGKYRQASSWTTKFWKIRNYTNKTEILGEIGDICNAEHRICKYENAYAVCDRQLTCFRITMETEIWATRNAHSLCHRKSIHVLLCRIAYKYNSKIYCQNCSLKKTCRQHKYRPATIP